MKKVFNIKIGLILSCLLLVVLLPSCDDDDDNVDNGIELLSFGPSGVQHGEQIQFIGNHLDRVDTVELADDILIPKADFVSQSNEIIELVIPEETVEGYVVLHTSEGLITTKTMLSFNVPVEVTSFSPSVIKPGSNITFRGNYMNWVETVVFASNVSVSDFESQSMMELVVKVPAEAQTGLITLYSGGTEPMAVEMEEELEVVLPTISALSPLSIKHAEQLTITGTDLDLVSAIRFPNDSVVSDFISQSETSLAVEVPVTSTSGAIVLIMPSTVEVKSTDEISIILPITTSIAPELAELGDDVTITGTDLDLIKSITFKASAVTITEFVSQSPTQIVVTVPEDAKNGPLTYQTIYDFEVISEVSASLNVSEVYFIFDEALNANWQLLGGWGTELQDAANTEQPKTGNIAYKVIYNNAYGAIQLQPNASDAGVFNNFNTIELSVYGMPGTDGNTMSLQLVDAGGADSESTFTIHEGEYKVIEIPISNYTGVDLTNINQVYIKNFGVTNNAVYVDDFQLK
ncbi:IPT/TIG domain-containing protein [Fulvivirga maritima]|uniref:IPT/TIG domain-containing protein n=1 Tax=Fulvivirga maritima TaxID=2904247 RepID=UPI001F32D311|nr:IPT/TIG domain-containing protein [Fulvivirga maritima]UII24598.1 IPT/TIG domain-containing protein [Fulvivirga maritima]